MRLLIFFILTLLPFCCSAEGNEILVISDIQGNNYAINLGDNPEISFDKEFMLVNTNMELLTFPRSSLKSYSFNASNSIDELLDDNDYLYMKKSGLEITLMNLPTNTPIILMNINGMVVDKFTVPIERVLTISIEKYPQGVYVLKVGKLTGKFVR